MGFHTGKLSHVGEHSDFIQYNRTKCLAEVVLLLFKINPEATPRKCLMECTF